MNKRSSIAASVLGIFMIGLLIWMIFPQDRKAGPADCAEGATLPGEQGDDAGAKVSAPAAEEVEQVRDGKFKERPGPEEVAKLRYERKRRELLEKMDGMKKRGLGDVHPAVRSVAEALENLDAEQGVAAGP